MHIFSLVPEEDPEGIAEGRGAKVGCASGFEAPAPSRDAIRRGERGEGFPLRSRQPVL